MLPEDKLDLIIAILKQHDKQFEQIDKRFEQIDKRFEQSDKRADERYQHLVSLIKDEKHSREKME